LLQADWHSPIAITERYYKDIEYVGNTEDVSGFMDLWKRWVG
jgi:hypothetical protein